MFKGVSTSIFVVFENRYYILFGESTFWKHIRKYGIAISYILVPLYFLPPQLFIPEQEKAREIAWDVSLGAFSNNFGLFSEKKDPNKHHTTTTVVFEFCKL